MMICFALPLFAAVFQLTVGQPPDTRGLNRVCILPKVPGAECVENRPTLRWYYNPTIGTCVSFMYKGCFANANNFKSASDCQFQCTHADGPICAPLTKPQGMCEPSGKGCQPGFECVRGAFLSYCCDAKKEEEYRDAVNPKCERGEAYRPEQYGSVLLADSCNEIRCPNDHKCVQGKRFAHCCQAAPGEIKKVPKPAVIASPGFQFRPPATNGLVVAGNTVEQVRPVNTGIPTNQRVIGTPFAATRPVQRRDPRCYSQPSWNIQGATMTAFMYNYQTNQCMRIPTNWLEFRQFFFRFDDCVNSCRLIPLVNSFNQPPTPVQTVSRPRIIPMNGFQATPQQGWVQNPGFNRFTG